MSKEKKLREERDEIDGLCNFLADITGLTVTQKIFSSSPEQVNLSIALGKEYEISISIEFTNEWSDSDWLSVTSWRVAHLGNEIFAVGGMVDVGHSFSRRDLFDLAKGEVFARREILFAIGGPNPEYAFMDYETYTLDSLRDNDSYFRNIYLVLMTHLKERGLQMPPILSKHDEIRKAMRMGNIEVLDRQIAAIRLFETTGYEPHCQRHMDYEIETIRQEALWEKKRRDPQIPLEETYPDIEMVRIETGEKIFRPVNILLVENDLGDFGFFSGKIVRALKKDGRFKDSQVLSDFNLPHCISLCETGKIDMVIFQWTDPSYEEVLMLQGERNPFFDLFNGKIQGVVEFGPDGTKFGLPDGRMIDRDALRHEGEKLDIRMRWMEMIAAACLESGVTVPSFFIVRDESELQQIAAIVCQKLGRPIH